MVAAPRQFVGQYRGGFTEVVELVLDVVIADDLLVGGEEQRAVVELDAGRLFGLVDDDFRDTLAVDRLLGQYIDLVGHEQRADEDIALGALTQCACIEHPGRPGFDLEARRQLELLGRQVFDRRRYRECRHRRHLHGHIGLGSALGPAGFGFLGNRCRGGAKKRNCSKAG